MSAATQGRSKTVATWIALLGGSLGLHRFYLHGGRDLGDEDDSHPRSKSLMRSQSVTTLSKSACSVRA